MTVFGLAIDGTIHLSDVVLVGGGVWAFLRIAMQQRDFHRDLIKLLRGDPENHRTGLIEELAEVRRDMYDGGGTLHRMKGVVDAIRYALASKGILPPGDPRGSS